MNERDSGTTDLIQKMILKQHPVCQEAGKLLDNFRLFLSQGFITGLKPEAKAQYLTRLEAIKSQIGQGAPDYV